MLQHNLLHDNSVYMVGSCCGRLLHIIQISAVSNVGVLQRKLFVAVCVARNLVSKLNWCSGSQQSRVCCKHVQLNVNAPVVFLCYYFAVRLLRSSGAACRVQCNRSYSDKTFYDKVLFVTGTADWMFIFLFNFSGLSSSRKISHWKSHCGDKMVVMSSYLHDRNFFYTDKTTSFWISFGCFDYKTSLKFGMD